MAEQNEIKEVFMRLTLPVILSGLIFAGCVKKEKTNREMLMPIDVAEVVVDSVVIYKDFPGILKANTTVDLVGRVNGYLKSKNYTPGDIVKRGQVLFTIEDDQYRNAVDQAEAQLTTARSTHEYNTRQYEAMKKAYEKDAVSEMEVIQAKSNYEESMASIKNCEAALRTAKLNLSYCTVTAPFEGRVTSSTVSVGAYIGGEGNPVTLATIYDNSIFYAEFYIDDSSYLNLNANRLKIDGVNYDSIPVRFTDPYPHSYYGTLDYLAPDINTGTGTMLIKVKMKNYHEELRDGMYATISLPSQSDPHAVLVKDASIGTDQLGKYVYVVNDSNKVVYTSIKIGDIVNDSMRVVNSGLKEGNRYVTKALLKVRNGEEIKPVLTK